ncbi:MAG TPA: tail fiber domain-containing protein, partial [Longimicrobium sp.]
GTTIFNWQAILDGNGAFDRNDNPATRAHSIIADSGIRTNVVDILSDARIKDILHPSDAATDLTTLLGIQITDYRLKDAIEKGTASQKKVIAQQVESIYPQAVTRSVGVVPDIYQRAPIAEGWVTLATDLAVGDRVRLIAHDEQGVYEVLELRKDGFRTAFQPPGDKVFVFGREVNDFRSVDYDAIAMLNVSATQELHRKLSVLEKRVAELELGNKARDARLTALEKLLPTRDLPIRKVAQKTNAAGN